MRRIESFCNNVIIETVSRILIFIYHYFQNIIYINYKGTHVACRYISTIQLSATDNTACDLNYTYVVIIFRRV